jgi:uncharacterized oxidoreductase
MTWKAHHALVTGGTRGIGEQLVRDLVQRGVRVTATGTRETSVRDASARLPQVHWEVLAQGSAGSRAAFAERIAQADFDLVIHNAGIQQLRDWTAPDAAVDFDTEREMQINFVGPVELTRLLLPQLARQQQAAVVFVTSGLALAPKQSSPVYCASKAALRSFAKSLRAQLRGAGLPVRVIEALPPIVDTDMTRGRGRGKISTQRASREILAGIDAGRQEIDVGATQLLRLIQRISPSLAGRIMINR